MNPTRERLLLALAEMSKLHPEWRLSQMLCNLVFMARHPMTQQKAAEDAWDIEDEELIAVLHLHIEQRHRALHDEAPAADSTKVA